MAAVRAADEHAFELVNRAIWAHRTKPGRVYARITKDVAEAYEVAADAWEEAGDLGAADARRKLARSYYVRSFRASHDRVGSYSSGWYLLSNIEAGRLATASKARLPKRGWFVMVNLTPLGPSVELHHELLTEREMAIVRRKRPGAYLVAVPNE